MNAHLLLAPPLFVLLAAQSDPAPAPLEPKLEAICSELTKSRTELMDDCLAQEELSFIAVLTWLGQYGLLTPDGALDHLALLEGQLDPVNASDTPAGVAAFCFETSPEWVSLQQCLEAFASAPGFGQPDPFGLGSGPNPLLGN
jgi:hypothetical protein